MNRVLEKKWRRSCIAMGILFLICLGFALTEPLKSVYKMFNRAAAASTESINK